MIKVDWLLIEIPLQTDKWMDGRTDNSLSRVAFATEKSSARYIHSKTFEWGWKDKNRSQEKL